MTGSGGPRPPGWRVGLSSAHNCRNPKTAEPRYKVTVWNNGRLLDVKDTTPRAPQGGGIRGEITGFSRASRRRLLRFMASVDQSRVAVPLFATVTYPGQCWESFGGSKEEVKRHLRLLREWLMYHQPGATAIWRLEFQKRGAPHLHLLVFGVGFIDHLKLADYWYEVVGSGQETHRQAGTGVERCKTWEEATSYVAKYVGKEQTFEGSEVPVHSRPGRIWGIWGKKNLPRLPMEYALTDRQFFELRRIVRGYCKSTGYQMPPMRSLSTFMGSVTGHRALAWVGADLVGGFAEPDASAYDERPV